MAKQSKLDFLKQGDAGTLRAAEDVLSGGQRKGFFARLSPFLGPAFIASVAYVDPGNYATNIQAGSQFGYMLLWVIVASNLMAMLIQACPRNSALLRERTWRSCVEPISRPGLPSLCGGAWRLW